MSQLGSLLFTLPLVNIVVHVAVVKAFGKFKDRGYGSGCAGCAIAHLFFGYWQFSQAFRRKKNFKNRPKIDRDKDKNEKPDLDDHKVLKHQP